MQSMEQRLSVLTMGVDDLPAMKKFYEDLLGWQPLAENKDVIFYKMNGFLFSLCKRKPLADFIGINPEGNGFRAITFGYNVPSEDAVRTLYESLKNKGVRILSEPTRPSFGGLFFYFEDIEGNVLEIAFNPYVLMDKNWNAVGHKSIDAL